MGKLPRTAYIACGSSCLAAQPTSIVITAHCLAVGHHAVFVGDTYLRCAVVVA